MKLSEYIKHLQEIEKEYGGNLDMVSYSDKYDRFIGLYFLPVAGTLIEDNNFCQDEPDTYNAICIN